MFNPGLIKAYMAKADAEPYTIAKFGANDYEVLPSSAAADAVLGVFTEVGAQADRHADVVLTEMPAVRLGGTVARGAKLTANASGQAVTASTGNSVLGVAMAAGDSGDLIPVLLTPGAKA